jgi:hypothetical protein
VIIKLVRSMQFNLTTFAITIIVTRSCSSGTLILRC